MKEINFNDHKNSLTEKDIDQIIEVIGSRCRVNTIIRLRNNLTFSRAMIPTYGILSRLTKERGEWGYCAGQSYPDEIRTVRNIILNLR